MKISYCTWIKNRYPQFRQVYAINLSRLGPDDEWIVVDVDSTDELSEWVPTDPRVKLHNHAMGPLHFAKLYNVSHRLGAGDYLVNLDADNYLGPQYRDWVQSLQGAVGHSWSQDWHDGTYGRIAIPRQAFYDVGGYDEALLPCGFQDADILQRLSGSGWELATSYDKQVYGGAVPNTRDDTMRYVDPAMTFDEYNSRNHQTTLRNLAAQRLRAN
jgi:glycosyltransferase involved in cell wall biosynthesis